MQNESEKYPDVTPFRNQSCLLQREINQVQLNLAEEMYKIKQIDPRLKELAHESSHFKFFISEVAELVQS